MMTTDDGVYDCKYVLSVGRSLVLLQQEEVVIALERYRKMV